MKSDKLFEAIGNIDDESVVESVETFYKKTKAVKQKGTIRTVLIAAVIVSVFAALSAVAYAVDFLGMRALISGKSDIDGTEYSAVSITRPQQIPDYVGEDVKAKIENVEKAWAEWEIARDESLNVKVPRLWEEAPHDSEAVEYDKNEDGTYTVRYSKICDRVDTIIKEVIATEEEMEEWHEYDELLNIEYPGYDFSYRVHTAQQAAKLEEIAQKYGLNLRREAKLAFSSETTGQTGQNFNSNKALAEKTAEIGCSGNMFKETPSGFDKLYWFGEGTFCASYYVELHGVKYSCYAINNMYSTLTSGREVGILEQNADGFSERKFTASDGTELTILENGECAYIYTYLENSYFVEQIEPMDGEIQAGDIDYIADYLNYSVIGK